MSSEEKAGKSDVLVSVVAPVRNAAEFIGAYTESVSDVLAGNYKNYEIILVDDGSIDDTVARITAAQSQTPNIQLYCLSTAFGTDIATVAGLDNCIGDFIVMLDPRHDPPALIPEMVERGTQGFDIVYGTRSDRAPGARTGIYGRFARGFYRLIRRLTGVYIPEDASSYRMVSRRVLNYVLQNERRHRLLKVIPAFSGYRYTTVPYTRLGEGNAKSRPNILSAFFDGIAIVLTVSAKPLRFATVVALIASALNLLYALYVVAIALLKEGVIGQGWISASLQSAGMFFLISLILAILSEQVYEILQRTQKQPLYHISKESTSSVLDGTDELNVVGALDSPDGGDEDSDGGEQ